jgi:hypothetical protein
LSASKYSLAEGEKHLAEQMESITPLSFSILLNGTYRSCTTVWWQGECNRLAMWTSGCIPCLELLQLLKLKYMVWLKSNYTVAVFGDVQ